MNDRLILIEGVPVDKLQTLAEKAFGPGKWLEGRNLRRYISDDHRYFVDVSTVDEHMAPLGDTPDERREISARVFDALVAAAPDAGFELIDEDDQVIRRYRPAI